MNHQEVRKRMGEYLDGDLTLRQRALFDSHLDGCVDCSAELGQLRNTVGLLRSLPGPDVPPHLAERVVARVRDGEGQARWWDGLAAFWDAIDPARYLPPLAGAALTTAVVLVGVRDLGWQIPGLAAPSPAPPPEVARPLPIEGEDASTPRMQTAESAAVARRLTEQNRPGIPIDVVTTAPNTPAPSRPIGASAADDPPAATAPKASEELASALEDPEAFLERLRRMGPPEAQEAWLVSLAAQAAEHRRLGELTARLREGGGSEGDAVAVRLEAAARTGSR